MATSEIPSDEASARSSFPTRSQTTARSAPVPAATIWAIRGRTSSEEHVPAIRPAKSDSTSCGVARLPYTTRLATLPARCRPGTGADRGSDGRGHEHRWGAVRALAERVRPGSGRTDQKSTCQQRGSTAREPGHRAPSPRRHVPRREEQEEEGQDAEVDRIDP